MLITDNFRREFHDFEYPTAPGDNDLSTRFCSFWDGNNSEEDPLPSRLRDANRTVLTAQLLHKAALLEDDPDRHVALLDRAQSLYDRAAAGPDRHTISGYKAREFSADISFHLLINGLRSALAENDVSSRITHTDSLRKLMIKESQELIAQSWNHAALSDEYKLGILLEKAARLAAWDSILDKALNEGKVPRIAVRKAFDHEDRALEQGLPLAVKGRFDVAVTRSDKEGVTSLRPVQLKVSSGNGYRGTDRASIDELLPLIVTTDVKGINVLTLQRAAEAWIQKYEGGDQPIPRFAVDQALRALGLKATR